MAVVKVTQIRSTLKAAIEYILDDKKTNGGLLTSSNCGIPFSADSVHQSFEQSLIEADRARVCGPDGTVFAHHVIQSFKPGEIDQNRAHDLGVEFVEKITGGEHDYVIATHVDRGHIHNHIMFCSVNRTTLKRFRMQRRTLKKWREISDDLCRVNGLSVIENPGQNRAPGEVHIRAWGRSQKARLEERIDEAVRNSFSLESFKNVLKEMKVQTRFNGGQILFYCPDISKREFRGTTLGAAYTEAALMARLGRENLSEFVVQSSLVAQVDDGKWKVKIPGLRPAKYLIVNSHQLNNHGSHWRLFLPDNFEARLIDHGGKLDKKVTVNDLYNGVSVTENQPDLSLGRTVGFTRIDPVKQSESVGISTFRRGKTEGQRGYFAHVDKKIEELREEVAVMAAFSEYENSSDKNAYVLGLKTDLIEAQKQLEKTLVKQQVASDEQRVSLLETMDVTLAARRVRILRSVIKQVENSPKKSKTKARKL